MSVMFQRLYSIRSLTIMTSGGRNVTTHPPHLRTRRFKQAGHMTREGTLGKRGQQHVPSRPASPGVRQPPGR